VIAVAIVGLAVIVVFSNSLAEALRAAGIDADLIDEIMAHASKLAALEPPAGVSPRIAMQIRIAIDQSFAAGYRAGLLIAASAAALAAILAAIYLTGLRRRARDPSLPY
jgi:TRAP-type C4-dicarboxylate transport system permease large subunit